jgi:large subunit ribosomal protein L31
MKKAIHPQLFQEATTTCVNCNAVYVIPSTIEKQSVESCRACNPIYTGKVQKEAKGGRIDRFRQRMSAKKE